MRLTFFALSLLFVGCASRKFGEDKIDTKLEVKGNASNGVIGYDKKELVIQNKVTASDELRVQEHVNENLASKLNHEHYLLRCCREDLGDKRLGGSGEVSPIPEVDNIKSDPEYLEIVGTDEKGDIVFLRKENFKDRIQSERNYEVTLKKLLNIVTKNREECERRMGAARIKAGLPAKRFKGTGHYENGKWVQDHPEEQNLDDAFRISSSGGQK